MTIFHLVRHGAYPLLGVALGGRAPHSLSEEGRLQAGRVAEALGGRPIDAVVSSPMQRALETAAPIASRLGLGVDIAQDLAEIDFGPWTGLAFEDVKTQPGWREWNDFRSTAAVPGVEAMLAVQARAVARTAGLAQARPKAEIVLVSHGDVIKALLAHLLGMPLDLLRRLDIGPASTSRVLLEAGDARVLAVNLPP